jgi:dienelactone hydrolase
MKMFAEIALVGYTLLASLDVAGATQAQDCHVGSYRLRGNRIVDIGPSNGGALRWILWSGETGKLQPQANGTWTSKLGWTNRSDGKSVSFPDCSAGTIIFDKEPGERIDFETRDTAFESDGVKLAGRLLLPKGSRKVPVVVLVHGAEHDSALDNYWLQRMFPAQGIGAFVYDKRGTGASGGAYTQDFAVLASDVIAATNEARRLAGRRLERIGYQGGSQGGWVVPLAANRTPVDFAIVSFGLAVTIMEEDQQSVALDMHFHHHSAADTVKALQLARAGEHVIETGGKEGYEEFNSLRKKYKSEPWYKDVHGDFVFFVMTLDQEQIIDFIARNFNFHTPFHYEPMPALRESKTPQLWVLGSDDLESPSAETARRIRSLIAEGRNYSLAVYPGVEHGMTEYELDARGERVSTRFAAGYFQMMVDFIRNGYIQGRYGRAQIKTPGSGTRRPRPGVLATDITRAHGNGKPATDVQVISP